MKALLESLGSLKLKELRFKYIKLSNPDLFYFTEIIISQDSLNTLVIDILLEEESFPTNTINSIKARNIPNLVIRINEVNLA